eukprot:TRINITY_DN1159_c0_g2_i7.p1 TRINITY_DN1159_c0_g2~~TRINITY_DN1159_c0_g2_i7.p1  ORF type:complete len:404 (+),score=47.88 TRINITY_DN1159_c0_g2_i7:460-1671(+)
MSEALEPIQNSVIHVLIDSEQIPPGFQEITQTQELKTTYKRMYSSLLLYNSMKKEHIKIPTNNYDSDGESKNGNDSLSKLTKRERDDSDSSSDDSPPPEPVKKQKGSKSNNDPGNLLDSNEGSAVKGSKNISLNNASNPPPPTKIEAIATNPGNGVPNPMMNNMLKPPGMPGFNPQMLGGNPLGMLGPGANPALYGLFNGPDIMNKMGANNPMNANAMMQLMASRQPNQQVNQEMFMKAIQGATAPTGHGSASSNIQKSLEYLQMINNLSANKVNAVGMGPNLSGLSQDALMKAFSMGNPAIVEMMKQRGLAGMAGVNLGGVKMEAATKQEFLATMTNTATNPTQVGTPGDVEAEDPPIGVPTSKRPKRDNDQEEGITTSTKPARTNGEIKIEDNNAEHQSSR